MVKNILSPSWENAECPARAELVFEHRNKNYGAYLIRLLYPDRIKRAFIYAAFGFILAISAPVISEWISSKAKEEFKATKEVEITLTEPPPLDETPPPPPPPPPQQLRETVKFTPPKVVDKPVEEEQPPPQEKLSETTVSTETQEGEKEIELPPEPVVDPDEGKIFTIVEEMPSFPGGETKLYEFIVRNTKYPPVARENGITGRVYVTFIVGKDGKVGDVKVVRGIGAGCDEEAARVIKSFPVWSVGKQNGRPVQVQFTIPVNFTLK
ncbi:MAG TPA: TonB family protein [Bacteroidia bacterium]|nr:TonB family protein [Bacteroidia bacterium]